MLAEITFSTSELLTIAVPAGGLVIGWATFVTKMLYDIRTSTRMKDIQQDASIAELRHDVTELQQLLPRHIPAPE